MNNVSLFDKITAMVSGAILITFILTIIVCRFRYEWQREELDDYWKKCKDDDLYKTKDNNSQDDKK